MFVLGGFSASSPTALLRVSVLCESNTWQSNAHSCLPALVCSDALALEVLMYFSLSVLTLSGCWCGWLVWREAVFGPRHVSSVVAVHFLMNCLLVISCHWY